MGHTDTRWISNLNTLVSYVLSSPHFVIGQLRVKFRLPSAGYYFDMSYEAIKKFEAHVLPQPEVFFRISVEQYLMLMRRIGDSQNVESTCLQYLLPSDKLDSVFRGLFLSCGEGFTKLCEALCTNSTMSTLQIQLTGKAPHVLALSQAFDTNISSQSQLLTIDTGENRIMEVAIVMKVAIEEFAIMLHCNKCLQTIQIQSEDNSDQDWVKLVRPLTKDLDVQQANVNYTKLKVALLGARISIGVCAYICHTVLQSSTLREFTVKMASDYYDHWLRGVPSCRWIRALIRPLIVDGDGNQTNVTLTKLTLAIKGFQVPSQVVLVRPLIAGQDGQPAKVDLTKLNFTVLGEVASVELFVLIYQEVLQSSRLNELTVETDQNFTLWQLTKTSPWTKLEGCRLIRALVRSLIVNADGQEATVTLTKLNLADKGFLNRVVLVRPLISNLDGQQPNVDLTKLNLTVQGSRTSTLMCALIFRELLQSSTLRELTVQTLDHYGERFLNRVVLVRPLISNLDGQQPNVDLTKLNLTVQGGRTSTLMCALISHELLQSSTLRELTVETLDHYGDLLEGTFSYELIGALVRSLFTNAKGPQADVHTLTKLKLADEGFLTFNSNRRQTKQNVKFWGSGMSAAVYNLVFHVVLQSLTLKELTLETSDDYGDVLEGSPISALLQALVRPLVADEDGQQANVTLTKINLANVKVSPAMLADILPEALRRNSTLKELTVQISESCCDVLDVSPRCALVQALVRTLIGDPEGQKANVTLAKLNLVDEAFQNQVVLVRPPREDHDAQEANLDLTKLNVTVSNSGMSAAICDLIFHEVLQSSTLKEFTVENSNHYGNMVEGSPSCTLIRALVRSMIVDTDGPQANVTFTQLNLADEGFQDQVTLVRPMTTDSDGQQANVDIAKLNVTISGGRMSGAVCDLLFHEVLQSSTLKELTVETLDQCADISPSCALLQALVRPLIADEAGQEAKANLSKLTLVLPNVRVNGSWSHAIFGEILPNLLQRNSTLKELTVKAPHFYEEREETKEEKLCALLQSLKDNKSLEILNLSECQGILTQKVIPTLMDILLVNFTLRDINFGDSSIWYGVKEQLRKNEKYMQSCLRKLPVAKAQAARMFLCGGPYAGKTTLRKILIRCSEPGSKFHKTYLSPCKDLMIKSHDGIQKLRHGRLQLALRTRGIEICGLENNAGIRLSIWDMGGQEEFHAFHDFMFPNLSDTGNPSSFLLVCSPFTSVYMNAKKQPEVIYQELEYWLRFIASNTRKSISFKPKVVVVLTHADKVAGLATWAKGIVTRLQSNFGHALDLSPECIAVDARSSRSSNSISCLIQDNTQAILEKLPPVYEVCSVMRLVLADWRLQHPECPLISWQTFSDLCQDAQVPGLITSLEGFGPEYLLVDERRKAVAECLHDAGDIIFFNDFDFIVVDMNWFCHRVMGHLIQLSHDKFKDQSSMGSPADGFRTREYLEAILNDSLKTSRDLGRHGGSMQSMKAETLVKLMLRLELCFERTTGSLDDGLFIPMTLARESGCLWHWPTSNHDFQCNITKVVHFGRRLQCDDQNCTFIPPGLFCRLQVSLHNKFLGPSNHMTADYFLEKDLILIVFNGVEIVLEYHGNVGTHIDVLVRSSSMSFDDALEIVHEHVMTHVQELCVSSGGCQGVLLVEGIVRPECVRQQISFLQRQNQAALVEDLKRAIEASGSRMRSYQHTWSRLKEGDRVILDSSCEAAMDLLGSKEKEDVERRLNELQHSKGYDHKMNPLGGLTSSILEAQDSTFPKPMFYGESSKVVVPSSGDNRSSVQCLLPQDPTSSHQDIVLRKIEDLSIQISHLEERLCPMTKHIIDFFVKSSQHQVPRIVLFTKNDASMKQRLVTKFVPGMKALRLHLLCEYKTHVHKVEGKHGCEVFLQEKEWEEIHGLVVEGLKWVFLAIKVGAHISMGIGNLVPNPSNAYAKAVSDSVGSHLPIDWATVTPQELVMDAASAVRTVQKESAEQWLVDFLENKSILKEFGLQRVIYKDEQPAEVGWICEEHLKKGEQTDQLARLPRGGMGL